MKFRKEGKAVDDVDFCERVMRETGVLVSPGGACFGAGREFTGYVRFGCCCETEVLRDGLGRMEEWMRGGFREVGVVEG